MSAIPVVINGTMFPKGRSGKDQPVPCFIPGYMHNPNLSVGGGPVIPDPPPEIPTEPEEPPSDPGLAYVIKPAPETGGWGCAMKDGSLQWYLAPGMDTPGPKRGR